MKAELDVEMSEDGINVDDEGTTIHDEDLGGGGVDREDHCS